MLNKKRRIDPARSLTIRLRVGNWRRKTLRRELNVSVVHAAERLAALTISELEKPQVQNDVFQMGWCLGYSAELAWLLYLKRCLPRPLGDVIVAATGL